MHLIALFPMACAIVGFVLSILCLFAGSKPGFMEEYHIAALNTSALGHNLLSAATTSDSSGDTSIGSFFRGRTRDITDSIKGEIGDDLDSFVGDTADELSEKLGIKQWYSMHLMDMCEGIYTPDSTDKDARMSVISCTNQTAFYQFNISRRLDQELARKDLHIDLSNIDWLSDIQGGLNALNTSLNALFVLYAIGIAAAGVAILSALVAVFLPGPRIVSWVNLGLTFLSFFTLLIASLTITIVQIKAVGLIDKYGNDVGLSAYKGNKFLVLTWVAVAIMFSALTAWAVEYCISRKNRKREYTEKPVGGSWWRRRKEGDEPAADATPAA